MENFIIVLISIGALLYNLYKNYMKEMEKSKSRKPNMRTQPIPTEINIPQSEKIRKKPKQKDFSYYTDVPTEVLTAQESRRVQNLTAPKTDIQSQELKDEKNEIDFDLRKAIIQAAILERPYK
ncbi:hypothetical protein [Sphingobacterium bovistauri]|uniref:Uncharacterized protein n=1 Tax=Sphingobacterium bovistauri TaxID=2781959 RepID=A0ABS7ZB74_9SPHI|nr:hypothetical protein [Sphingobacterium bovistauri]MCA5006852.1 hypothetical protein [Sphingobacterium bovistauri]